jgi:GT2 family glycosyltransferase
VTISVAICTYEPPPATFARVLDAVRQVTADSVQVDVIDMSRGDAVQQAVAQLPDRFRYDAFLDSRGLSDSRNRALDRASGRYVAFLDSDAIAQPGWLEPLERDLEDDDVAVVGSRVLPAFDRAPGRLLRSQTARDWMSLLDLGTQRRDVEVIVGTSFAVDRERLPSQGFDLTRGLRPGVAIGGEEVQLCQQVRRAGSRVLYEPASVVSHVIPAERSTWRAMLRRAYLAGQETALQGSTGDPHQRHMALDDHAFRAAVAPAFLLGRLKARGGDSQ